MKTIKDIADLSGYSIGTVSRVLNERPDVSEEAKNKIQEIIDQEGYRPNTHARHLKQTKGSAVTVFVKGANSTFLNSILEKIQRYLRENNEEVRVVFLTESDDEVEYALKVCQERRPKGLLFLGGDLNNFKKGFRHISVPSVLITGFAEKLDFDNLSSFCTDDYEGGKAAMKNLLENGHRNIAVIGGFLSDAEDQVSNNRLQGVRDAMQEKGLDPEETLCYVQCRFSSRDGYEKTREILAEHKDITAVFAFSDITAVGALRAICDCGYSVPEDISLIGYDGMEFTEYTVPRISTVRQDIDQLAKKSVEDLLFRISYPRASVHRFIPFEVMDKESIRNLSGQK